MKWLQLVVVPLLLIASVSVVTAGHVRAADIWKGLDRIGEARVAAVVDGDTVVIEPALDGMNEVRLVGIQAPKLPLGREGFKAWPLADESRSALVDLVHGMTVTLYSGGARADRHGRHLAHLRLANGTWVQGELLRSGWARVYSFPDNRSLIGEMLALESESRGSHRGIWGHPNYAVRTPGELADLIGRFEIIEGAVLAAAVHKGTGYLNFDDDWRTDFTLVIHPPSMAVFDAAGVDPESYANRTVRVRGWLKSFNGPMIEVTHPEQIEILP
ncbi:MAG: thermonuclease family protein [Rhodospirillales bacterium]